MNRIGFAKSVGFGPTLVAEAVVYDLRHLTAPPLLHLSLPVRPECLAFSPDGSELAIGFPGEFDLRTGVRVYRVPSGELARSLSEVELGFGIGLTWIAGRRYVHTPEFLAAERLFKNYTNAEAWLTRLAGER